MTPAECPYEDEQFDAAWLHCASCGISCGCVHKVNVGTLCTDCLLARTDERVTDVIIRALERYAKQGSR